MPWYNDLRPVSDVHKVNYGLIFPELTNEDRKRTLANLLELRQYLDIEVPEKHTDKNLLLATWNIKEFGNIEEERLPESYFYIAEIINRFDLVAIQEIKRTVIGLDRIMRLLGSNWGYVMTDVTEGNDGNKERFGYIYDKRKVTPSGLSGEITLWDKITRDAPIKQLKRTPAITGFKAGWKQFTIINIHLQPGNDGEDQKWRQAEVALLLQAIEFKIKNKHFWNDNLVILGDTNLYQNNTDIVNLFTAHKFKEATRLKGKLTNVSQTEIYDRIFLNVNDYFKLITKDNKENGGVLRFFDVIYNEDKRSTYHDFMKLHKNDPETLRNDADFKIYYNRYWKRNQMSDHYPVWIEIEADSTDDFLESRLNIIP